LFRGSLADATGENPFARLMALCLRFPAACLPPPPPKPAPNPSSTNACGGPPDIPCLSDVPGGSDLPAVLSSTGSRRRGRQDPVSGLLPVDVGPCPGGGCNPCPDPPAPWEAPGSGHGSTGDSHWHWIEYDQNPVTCMCFPKRMSGPKPPR